MIFHDLGVPKTHQKSVPKTEPKTARFWSLLSPLLGSFWPLRWLKPVLKFLLERPRAVQEFFFLSWRPPGASQEASKSAPRGFQELKGVQDAPKRVPGTGFDLPAPPQSSPTDLQEHSKRPSKPISRVPKKPYEPSWKLPGALHHEVHFPGSNSLGQDPMSYSLGRRDSRSRYNCLFKSIVVDLNTAYLEIIIFLL